MTSTGTSWEGEAPAEPRWVNEPRFFVRLPRPFRKEVHSSAPECSLIVSDAQHRTRLSGSFALPIVCFVVLGSSAFGQEANTPESSSVPEVAAAEQTKPPDAAEELARKRKLRIAIVTGGLIAVTGMAMVALTILGGSATRRGLRRKPLTVGAPPPEPIPADRFDEAEAENSGPPEEGVDGAKS